VAKLRAQAVAVRKASLSLRPRALPELMVAARMLQIDLISQPQLVWLVDVVLACDFMPAGWEAVPRECMTLLAHKSSAEEIQMAGLMSSVPGEALRAIRHVQEVEWLPPLERLWHVATTGTAPPQFQNQLCSLITERHPCDGFVRSVLGQPKEPKIYVI